MRHPQDIVRQPLITEKSTVLREDTGVYCFKVHRDANKIEIARAIEALFAKDKVKVAHVRTACVRGTIRRSEPSPFQDAPQAQGLTFHKNNRRHNPKAANIT